MPNINIAIYPKGKLDVQKTSYPNQPIYTGRITIEVQCNGLRPIPPINDLIKDIRARLERIIADNPNCTTFD